MTSLLQMTEQELAQHEAREGFAAVPALAVAGTSAALALGGMLLRYAPGDDVPIRGMDQLGGQLALSLAVFIGMLGTAWLVQSVLMKRLQWAVLLSLLIHFVIGFMLRTVMVDVPVASLAELGADVVRVEEVTLPDYGGAESLSTEPQEWERPTDVDVAESEQHQLQRQTAEISPEAEPEKVNIVRDVTAAAIPERQQQEQELDVARRTEMNRRSQPVEADAPEQLQAPEVRSTEATEPTLEARAMERLESELQAASRSETVPAERRPEVTATEIAPRSTVRPQEVMELAEQQQQSQRRAAEALAAEAAAESVTLPDTAEAPAMTVVTRNLDAPRQANPRLNDLPRSASDAASASRQMQVPTVNPAQTSSAVEVAISAPSAGPSGSVPRTSSAQSRGVAAAQTAAESVAVPSISGPTAPNLAAAQGTGVARGDVSVPTGAASGGGAPATRLQSAATSVASTAASRGRGMQVGPQLGQEVSAELTNGTGAQGGSRQLPSAAGTRAEGVTVAAVGNGGGATERVLAAGPSSAASGVGRSGTDLPVNSGRGTASATGQTGPSTGSRAMAATVAGRGRLADAATESGVELGSVISGQRNGNDSAMAPRAGPGIALPSAALRAEQSGDLVIAGPQVPMSGQAAAGGVAGRLTGPRVASVPRRSAGLPGISGPAANTRVARRQSTLPGMQIAGGVSSRPLSEVSRPKLATRREVAGLIKRTVPGISNIPTERISAAFSMRTPEARAEAVTKLGGNDRSEKAVDRGLAWLAAHQSAAGSWSIHSMHCRDHDCGGHGSYDADPAATGLALLAFLGAGHTTAIGEYSEVVAAGLNWLIDNQASDGDLFAAETEFARFYSHGIATIALCEAYGMTRDRRFQEPAQKAVDYIVASQHPRFGGWRYQPQFESDTSVSGWQLMALKSAEMAGLSVPRSAYDGVRRWLDAVEDKEAPGRFAYHPTKQVTEPMTAEGLLMRQYLGADRTDPALQAGASFLQQRLPRADARNVYYWYYATQVMFHMQGEHWEAWNASLRDILEASQDTTGPSQGSWSPDLPTKDTWGNSGGRHYVTCLNLLMLEVYYRHLPLYIELSPDVP